MNKHKIIQWYQDNIDYVKDNCNIWKNDYRLNYKKYNLLFHDILKDQYYDMFREVIYQDVTFTLGVSYEECNDMLEDNLKNMWVDNEI